MIEPVAPAAIRVACVGDSITRGTFVWRRKKNAYPAQLQVMLGDRFCVRDFGVNGHAAQRAADRPYWNSEVFVSSAAFQPDIVLVMLGTNDSRGANWCGIEPFARDYRELVAHYRALDPGPTVLLMTPPALFRVWRRAKVLYGMDEGAVREMCGAIEGIAREFGSRLIDIHGTTAGHPEAFRFDGVHPGAAGARIIAEAVADALAGEQASSAAWPFRVTRDAFR